MRLCQYDIFDVKNGKNDTDGNRKCPAEMYVAQFMNGVRLMARRFILAGQFIIILFVLLAEKRGSGLYQLLLGHIGSSGV